MGQNFQTFAKEYKKSLFFHLNSSINFPRDPKTLPNKNVPLPPFSKHSSTISHLISHQQPLNQQPNEIIQLSVILFRR